VIAYPVGHEPTIWKLDPEEAAHRFVIGNTSRASPDAPPLIAVCMNPSRADHGQADRTVNRLIRASVEHGYGGWLMVNLYPERSTDPSALSEFDPALSSANCAAIERVLTQHGATEVLGAWGGLKHASLRRGRRDVLDTLARLGVRLFSFDEPTAGGDPRHPTPRSGPLPMLGPKRYLT
jgi:hypothetical protein